MLKKRQIEEFISQHRLPGKFRDLINRHYSPLATWVKSRHHPGEALFIGINGAQGAGKSTLAAFLQLALEAGAGWRVVVLSLDDFYLTRAERKVLGEKVHPLLETRGVPGTHDLRMLADCVERLKKLDSETPLALPRFDKSRDDRTALDIWPVKTGPIELIILEGWCVGSPPQPGDDLLEPINSLEREEDRSAEWRRYVNRQLEKTYADLFAQLDALIFLQVPDFDAVYPWRLKQEQKLAAVTAHHATGTMDRVQLARFIQHYERLTRANLATLSETADVVLELDENHDCVSSCYTTRSTSPGN